MGAPRHRRRVMRIMRVIASAALGAALLVLGACEPCAGVVGCSSSDARLAAEGRLLDPWSGRPSAGARLTLVRAEGVKLDDDSVSTTSDDDGRFGWDVGAAEGGEVVVDVIVEPRSEIPYRVRGLRWRASSVRGDGVVLPPWGTRLQLPYAGEMFYRFARNRLAVDIPVEFRRTSGAELYGSGMSAGVYRNRTDSAGRIPLFGDLAYATSTDDVVGELTVTLAAPYGRSTTKNVRLTPTPEFRPPIRVPRLGAGPSLEYAGVFHLRGNLQPIVGMRVDFRRIGGIPVQPESFTTVTAPDGTFIFPLTPLADGMLIGELTVYPPAPATRFTMRLEIPTLYQDRGQMFARWGIGPHLLWYGRLVARGVGVPNVDVELRRVGGIPVTPEVVVTKTRAQGDFPMEPVPLGFGELIADLHVRPPAPYAPFVVRGLRIPTSEEDVYARLYATWDLETGQQLPAAIWGQAAVGGR